VELIACKREASDEKVAVQKGRVDSGVGGEFAFLVINLAGAMISDREKGAGFGGTSDEGLAPRGVTGSQAE